MYDTMKQAEGGIGIAAPQIDVSKQVTLIELPENNERYGDMQGTPCWSSSIPSLKCLLKNTKDSGKDVYQFLGSEVLLKDQKVFKSIILMSMVNLNKSSPRFRHCFPTRAWSFIGKLYIDRITDTTKIAYNEEFSEHIVAHPDDTLDE